MTYSPSQTRTCVICNRDMPLAELTAGLVDARGAQQFACSGHKWDGNKFILGWAAFAIKQRQLLQQAALNAEYGNDTAYGRPLR
jgi:hypothetical protein